MAADANVILSEPKWFQRPTWKVVFWWEKRRPVFNLAVFVAGAISITIVEAVGSHFANPGEDAEEPLGIVAAIIVYGLAANLCYTAGWFSEVVWGADDLECNQAKRKKLFRNGMLFSVVLSLLPGILIPLSWVLFGFAHQPR